MDIPAMQALVAIAENGSFSRASEQLFITQPAMSKRIAALEAELGVLLVDRLGRNTRLTEAGENLLVSARRILADIESSREAVRSINDEVSGRLRLATSHHIGIHRLPPILKAYTQACPQVDLDLLFMDSEHACDLVSEGSIELAVVTLPEKPADNLHTQLIWNDPLSIVCANDHPLIKSKNVNPMELAKHPAVLPARGTVTRGIVLDAIAPHDVHIKTSLETNYLETIKVMVSVGLGWSALPNSMVDDSLSALPSKAINMQRVLGSVRLQDRTLSRAATALLELLPEH